MLNPKERSSFEVAEARFLEIIDKFGWHVMNVAPRTDSKDKQEWFSYSTGLFMNFRHPEIILCGLHSDVSTRIINEIGNAIKSGSRFDLDTDYPDIFAGNVKCRFRVVHASHYGEYVCWAQWFYESDDFPVWQCFWPDKANHYPWESACHPEVTALQPFLYKPSQQII
jgi:hypothetical protein